VPGPLPTTDWEVLKKTALNPLAPTFEEALAHTLTDQERDRFENHVRAVPAARYARNRRLTEAVHQWAFCAMKGSPGARTYYNTRLAGVRATPSGSADVDPTGPRRRSVSTPEPPMSASMIAMRRATKVSEG
jgi:hypothetical protein